MSYLTDDIIEKEKQRIKRDHQEFYNALLYYMFKGDARGRERLLLRLAILADYGLEHMDPHRDPRLDGEALQELQTFGEMVDKALEDWITAQDIE